MEQLQKSMRMEQTTAVQRYLVENEYDTDTIDFDTADKEGSFIAANLGSETLRQFRQSVDDSKRRFECLYFWTRSVN